jgi:murein DD-endopeptidase MepM/ murein hydrolase activator NlpD
MEDQKQKRKFIRKLRDKYRLVILNDSTFEEVLAFRLSRLNVIAYFGLIVILLTGMVTVLITFTPLREYIPGYPDGNMRRNILRNATMVDSLESELRIRDQYVNNIKNIILGNHPTNYKELDSMTVYDDISFSKAEEDSLFQLQVEQEEQYNFSVFSDFVQEESITRIHFFTPLKGLIINKFNFEEQHLGVDIVASEKDPVAATLDGTVIMSSWTLETGNVLQIQHANGYISIYKHNAEILKKTGDMVKAGDVIAIFGNTGEFSTGPHLHFELWHKGVPVNPEEYINF